MLLKYSAIGVCVCVLEGGGGKAFYQSPSSPSGVQGSLVSCLRCPLKLNFPGIQNLNFKTAAAKTFLGKLGRLVREESKKMGYKVHIKTNFLRFLDSSLCFHLSRK